MQVCGPFRVSPNPPIFIKKCGGGRIDESILMDVFRNPFLRICESGERLDVTAVKTIRYVIT